MRRRLVLALLWLGPAAPSAALDADLWAPDTAGTGSVEAIREHTTAPEYLPATVAYLPEAPDVPSPLEVLGRIPGAAGELSSVATVHGYFRRLAEASDRVEVEVIGHSEEGREILLARISDAANLARLDRLRQARVGGGLWPAGTYAVRMDQPYRNAAVNFLDVQRFPADEPNPPYDDVAWTWPLLYGVEGQRVDDRGVLDAAMEPVLDEVRPRGAIAGEGPVHLLGDTGQNAVLGARLALGGRRVEVAEEPFEAGGRRFDVILMPHQGGDFARLVHGTDPAHGPLAYTRTAEYPSHGVPDASEDITGGMGFAGLANLQRFVADGGTLITLLNAGTLVVDGGLVRNVRRASGFNTPGSELAARVLRPRHPVTYGYEEATSVFRGNGPLFDVPERYRGRVLVLLHAPSVGSWSVLRAAGCVAPPQRSPTTPSSERLASDANSSPATRHLSCEGGLVQLGTRRVGEPEEEEEEEEEEDPGPAGAPEDSPDPEAGKPAAAAKERPPGGGLVLSGYVSGEKELDGKPAILDVPVGRGRVLIFNFNPLHRHLNHSDFRFVYNALLNWDALP